MVEGRGGLPSRAGKGGVSPTAPGGGTPQFRRRDPARGRALLTPPSLHRPCPPRGRLLLLRRRRLRPSPREVRRRSSSLAAARGRSCLRHTDSGLKAGSTASCGESSTHRVTTRAVRTEKARLPLGTRLLECAEYTDLSAASRRTCRRTRASRGGQARSPKTCRPRLACLHTLQDPCGVAGPFSQRPAFLLPASVFCASDSRRRGDEPGAISGDLGRSRVI